ncbi:MAG: DUF4136 domain-containing protein [Bacteroidota bacterium]
MKKNIWYSGMPVMFMLLMLTSCYPDEENDISELDIVMTQYDVEFDFSTKQYFLLPDTVPIISSKEDYEKSEDELQLDNAILEEITVQMRNAGYMQLQPADTANDSRMNNAVVVLASRATVSYTDYYYDYYNYGYDYWGGYYGFNYYYPGYRWNHYYPWGYPVAYSYSVGTVIIEMIDPAEPFEIDDANGEVTYPVRWMAVLNGMAELSLSNTEERTIDGIMQAFDQSPYLYE